MALTTVLSFGQVLFCCWTKTLAEASKQIKRKIRQAERERECKSSRTLSFPAATVNHKKVPLKVKSLSFFHLFPGFSHLAFVWIGWLVKIFMCIWHSHCNLYSFYYSWIFFFLSGFCLNFYLRTERELGD